MYQNISEKLSSVQFFMCQWSYEKRYEWCVCVSVALCACQQVKFSSFPPHLPQAHRPLLSQSVSSETTYVSSSSLRAELSNERKPIAQKGTPACIQPHLHIEIRNSAIFLAGDSQQSPVGRGTRIMMKNNEEKSSLRHNSESRPFNSDAVIKCCAHQDPRNLGHTTHRTWVERPGWLHQRWGSF